MLRIIIAAVVALIAAAAPAQAQDWPTRPLTLVVPFAAGGAFDVMARVFTPPLSQILHQQVIVENMGAAAGIVGTNRVAKATPDGYTFLFGTIGTHAFNPALYKKLPYNALTDFVPVALIAEQPMVLLTRKDFPADTLPQFIAYVKANAAKLQYGSAGIGSTTHLGCSLLNAAIGVNVTHVPYRGSAPASNDLIGGQIDYLCGNLGAAAPLIIGKQVKAIAVLSRGRSPLMPELASAHEQGLTDFDVTTWTAFFLPKGAPRAIVDRLNEVAHATMDTPVIKSRMLAFAGRMHELGVTLVAPERRSPEYLQAFVKREMEKWAAPIKAAGISVD